ncbi:metal dependent phosphohydrolase [Denitrovibrio acetiphilus DSM 12809]|jgi:3'-5' exoribonuclease|uniref:Metal dependent phosphohydrolase n=1 Tax=Denitrovibrio acetiphilus (strain DSM 12809 / NBRC 114555 / N2460) TaxID=522772 RepID=D4H559_DENA2|nr:HD domain-containing protein [Denitrovibrio acetiphilus]ADD69415.1 metal dependent phosphohydrolase [Denitrovibrio acetiphilus DSM 12809]
MNKFLGDFKVIDRTLRISKNGAEYLRIIVEGEQGAEIAYCYNDVAHCLKILDQTDSVSLYGFRMVNDGKSFISVQRLMISFVQLYVDYTTRFHEIIKYISEDNCHEVFMSIYREPDIISSFFLVPASLNSHHAHMSGLLVHTVEAMEFGLSLCESSLFKYDIDKSTLLLGLFLHDIGKALCYKVEGYDMFMTDRGRKIGHVTMGAELFLNKVCDLKDFPVNLKEKLVNIILSHHYSSKVKPISIEANIVRNLDSLSASIEGLGVV